MSERKTQEELISESRPRELRTLSDHNLWARADNAIYQDARSDRWDRYAKREIIDIRAEVMRRMKGHDEAIRALENHAALSPRKGLRLALRVLRGEGTE